jgi:hypothetical protein
MQWVPEGPSPVELENTALRETLAALQQEHAKCDQRLRELQEHNTTLVHLTVASQLLSTVADREGVLDAIEQIVVNIIGSEELAVFELRADDRQFGLLRTRGVDPDHPHCSTALRSIGDALRCGAPVVPSVPGVTAVIPLRVDSIVFGALAIFRLLEQKKALDPTDHELLELLGRQGAVALFSASFQSVRPTVPPAKRAI